MIRFASSMLLVGSALVAVPAAAQSGCPQENPGPGQLAYPAITAFAMFNLDHDARSQADARARHAHEATAVGGAQREGRIRFEVELSEPVSTGCQLAFYFRDSRVSEAEMNNGMIGRLGEFAARRDAAPVVTGTGGNRVAFDVQTALTMQDRTLPLIFRLGRRGAEQPITVTLRPPAAPVIAVTPGRAKFGQSVTLTLTFPQALHYDGDDDPELTLGLTSDAEGFLHRPGTPRPSTSTIDTVDGSFSPQRVSAVFVARPAAAASETRVQIALAGYRETRRIAIDKLDCRPQAVLTPRRGAIDLAISNGGSDACPALQARFNGQSFAVTPLAPGAAPVRPTVTTIGGLQPVAKPSAGVAALARTPASGSAFEKSFVYNGPYPANGQGFPLTLASNGINFFDIPLTITGAGMAAIRGQ